MLYECRAPLRVDFGGGWTDVPFFAEREGGAVLNAAITVYVRGKLSRPDQTGWVRALRGNRSHVGYSLDAPSGAGLGASAAQTVLWAALVRASINNTADRAEIAEIACKIKDALGIVGGKQDEYASALGGLGFYTFTDIVSGERLKLSTATSENLQRRLVLACTGTSRVSSAIHTSVWERYLAGEPATVTALRSLKETALDMKQALESGDLDGFGGLLTQNWHAQRALDSSVTTPELDAALDHGARNGAVGGKACGAGGGGCVVFLSKAEHEVELTAALQAAGMRVIDFAFDTYGVYLNKG